MIITSRLLETSFTSMAIGTSAIIAATAMLYYYWLNATTSISYSSALKPIPTPKGQLPIFGHLLSINKLLAYKLKEWHDELGPVIRVQMGAQPWIPISDPVILHHLFVTNGAIGSDRPSQLFIEQEYAHSHKGIAFSNSDTKWKHLRGASMNLCLAPKIVQQNDENIRQDIEDMVSKLMSDSELHYSVDPLQTIRKFILKYVCRKCFGIDTKDEDFVVATLKFATEVIKRTGAHKDDRGFLPLFSFVKKLFGFDYSGENLFQEGLPFVRELLQYAIDSDEDCVFKYLYEKRDELDLDELDLLNGAADMITGATDNVAITTTTVYASLMHFPDVHKKLRKEVDEFIRQHGRLPLFSERHAFPYLNATQKEVMRYRGSNYITIPHTLNQDVQYKGYLFPKDTLIAPVTYALQKDPIRYPEPDKFKPERFLNDPKSMTASAAGGIDGRDHFVFGWGRRICPGMYLGEVQLFYMLTNLIARCDLELPKDGTMPDLENVIDAGVVVMPPPFELRFIHRKDSLLS